MRFEVYFNSNDNKLPKDYRRLLTSFLKKSFEISNKKFYENNYINVNNKLKNFCYSIYIPNAIYNKDYIELVNSGFKMIFSTSSSIDGINFYNAMLKMKNKVYKYKEIEMIPYKFTMLKETLITSNCAIFSTMSPIIIRDHNHDNSKTWFYSFDETKGKEVFLRNLKYQLSELNDIIEEDLNEIEVEVIKNKVNKIKNYNTVMIANSCILIIKAKNYILNYIYQSGVGSNRSRGFGLLEIEKKELINE